MQVIILFTIDETLPSLNNWNFEITKQWLRNWKLWLKNCKYFFLFNNENLLSFENFVINVSNCTSMKHYLHWIIEILKSSNNESNWIVVKIINKKL